MNIDGFDYEPTRVLVRTQDSFNQCDMIRRGSKCFLVPDWVSTHDGDVPAAEIEIDPSKLQRALAGSEWQFVYTGLVTLPP